MSAAPSRSQPRESSAPDGKEPLMTRLSTSLALLLGALAWLAPGHARADFVNYSYEWSVLPDSVLVGTNPGTGDGKSTGNVVFGLPAGSVATQAEYGVKQTLPGAEVTTSTDATQ